MAGVQCSTTTNSAAWSRGNTRERSENDILEDIGRNRRRRATVRPCRLLELEAITSAVLGGCALTGGRGTIIGGLLGVLIIGVLDNGLILTSVPTFYQMVAKGVLLIAAVVIAEQQARSYG